jgi:hypothetical protein
LALLVELLLYIEAATAKQTEDMIFNLRLTILSLIGAYILIASVESIHELLVAEDERINCDLLIDVDIADHRLSRIHISEVVLHSGWITSKLGCDVNRVLNELIWDCREIGEFYLEVFCLKRRWQGMIALANLVVAWDRNPKLIVSIWRVIIRVVEVHVSTVGNRINVNLIQDDTIGVVRIQFAYASMIQVSHLQRVKDTDENSC